MLGAPGSSIRFATFEVDAQSGELRKHGIRIKLQDQPFKILLALLERPGEVVSREELKQRIWGNDTFVDFDRGLSAAVNRLREALGDSADNPRYVETMARRGYRFIAPVEGPPQPAAAPQPPPAPARPPRKSLWIALALAAAAVSGTGIWLARRDSLPPPKLVRPAGFAGTNSYPSFSPDGTQVAFNWNGETQDNLDIYVMMLGGATALRLTSDPAADWGPAWSPDGRQIAFMSNRGQGGIYLVSPLGGQERKVLDFRVAVSGRPSWSPDGKFLAAAHAYKEQSDDPDNGAVLLIPAEGGSAPRRILAPQPGRWYEHPTFSRDGRQLAVSSCTGAYQSGGQSCQLEIHALNTELMPQGRPRAVSSPAIKYGGIAWTEDGSSLVVAGARLVDRFYLWRIPVSGTGGPERLEAAGEGANRPAIAAKGHRLAFARQDTRYSIWRWEQGGERTALLTASVRASSPQLSHDGRRIAFESNRGGDLIHVWVANADGTRPIQVTAGAREGTPRWSPDDRWIAYDSQANNGRWEVWVTEVTGGPARALTHATADSAVPSWSRDGNWVYFYSNRSGRLEIWRVPARGGPADQVTRRGGYTALESDDGKTLYYTKSETGAEGLFALPLAGGEEKQVIKDRVAHRGFVVLSDGIYYITWSDPKYEVRFHEFATGRSQRVFAMEGPLFYGLAVSPDRKTFLYTRLSSEMDLWMIENFR